MRMWSHSHHWARTGLLDVSRRFAKVGHVDPAAVDMVVATTVVDGAPVPEGVDELLGPHIPSAVIRQSCLRYRPGAVSECLRDPEHAALVAVGVDGDAGPVPLDEKADIGGEAAILQRAVEQVHREARLPVRALLPEQPVFVRIAPPMNGNPGRDRKAALEGTGKRDGEPAQAAAVTVLAGLDMFEVDPDPERRSRVERMVQAGAQGNGPAVQAWMFRVVAAFRVQCAVEPEDRRQSQATARPGTDPVAVALSAQPSPADAKTARHAAAVEQPGGPDIALRRDTELWSCATGARVRNPTSPSSTAEYFLEEGGCHVSAGGDLEAPQGQELKSRISTRGQPWFLRCPAA